ncbi:MAG: hypothetical protein KDA90_12965, partial [Planctomycetaceae bacterium]|nr:hypothetical protein [Planctomycetaceae bacterium]
MKRRLHASRRAGRFAVVITTIFACLTVTSSVWGWGAGHNDLQRAIIARLPPSFRKHLSEESIQISIRSWSHYPDSFETFDAESELIGPAGLAMLERYGVKRRYDLHHDRGRAVNFLLLVDSLRAKRYETALFWLSCLAHSTGDMAACNHDPLIHFAKYDWPHTGATVANGVAAGKFSAALDLSYAMEQPEGPAAFEAAIDSMTLVDNGHGPHEAILDVMMYGYEGAAICSTRGVPILTGAAAWLGHGDEEARGNLCRNMTELGAWAAVRATRDFEVAQRLALQDLQLELSDRTADAYNSRVEDWVQQSSLEDEVLYAPILNPLSASTNKAIGVVLEPTWRMNEGMLGFSDRVYAASICRTLAAADRSHVTLDIRDLARDGFPDPKQVSIVVIPATRFGNYHGMRAGDVDQHLQQYLDAGGRVVWIGGRHLPASVALAELRSAMTKTEKSN